MWVPLPEFSIRLLWYDGMKMWPLFLSSLYILNLVTQRRITRGGVGGEGSGGRGLCCSAKSSSHSSSLTSAFSSDVIRSYKWQLLAWSRIHQGGAARWPPALSPPPAAAIPHWLKAQFTLQTMTDKMMDQFSRIGLLIHTHPYLLPPPQSGYWHLPFSHLRPPESHNCWLVRWVAGVPNN